ncbi:hypothetical protein OC835_000397 [Tilletia horrida]|nr:hypothetical protein OC835_000397 [Tilletia horrida]
MADVLPPPAYHIAAAAGVNSAAAPHTMISLPHDYPFAFVAKVPSSSAAFPALPSVTARQVAHAAAPQSYQHLQPLQHQQHHHHSQHHNLTARAGITPPQPQVIDGSSLSLSRAQYDALSSIAATSTQAAPAPLALQKPAVGQSAQALYSLAPSMSSAYDRHVPAPAPASQPPCTPDQPHQQPAWTARGAASQDGVGPQSILDFQPAGNAAMEIYSCDSSTAPTTPLGLADATVVAEGTSASMPVPSRPSTERIANFFASLVCYIWFASGLPDTSPIATPSLSPTSAHAPLFPSPLANGRRSHLDLRTQHQHQMHQPQRSAPATAAGPSSTLPTDDFADRLSAAMERVSMTTAGASASGHGSGVADGGGHGMYARLPVSLRMQPSGRFVTFIKNLLTTTQVSSSVILLALLYIFRLKSRHPDLHGQEGSEYRLSVTSLMLANKWLDDHTYLNKTWSELSGIELRDVTKMEREFWSGLGMDISVSDIQFQDWLKQVENMTARREAKIQRRARDIRARQQQQRRARELSRTGSSSPSRRLAGRLIAYGARETDEVNQAHAPHNSPIHQWRPDTGVDVAAQSLRRNSHVSTASHDVGEGGFADMIGSRRLPPPLPSPIDPTTRDRSVPRRLFDSRPSSASSGGSFAAMHQTFKGLFTNSPSRPNLRSRENEVSPHRSNKRFAADPDWADAPFAFSAPGQAHSTQQTYQTQAAVEHPSAPLQLAIPTLGRVRAPRSVPAHEVHQSMDPSHSTHTGAFRNSDGYQSYAEALVAPFTGYDAALVNSAERSAPSLAYYEIRSGPYRSVQSTGEPAPFVQHQQEGWETLRQAAQYFAPYTSSASSYLQVSPETRWQAGQSYGGAMDFSLHADTGTSESRGLPAYGQYSNGYHLSPYDETGSGQTHAPYPPSAVHTPYASASSHASGAVEYMRAASSQGACAAVDQYAGSDLRAAGSDAQVFYTQTSQKQQHVRTPLSFQPPQHHLQHSQLQLQPQAQHQHQQQQSLLPPASDPAFDGYDFGGRSDAFLPSSQHTGAWPLNALDPNQPIDRR